jgi:tRNA nucleotidyltransferase/poly(A) polymerase
MKNIFNKLFFRSNNLEYINQTFKNLKKETEVVKIFEAINFFSSNSEIRYVGGCVRKIINKEKVDDIDLAVNLNPSEVCECLKNNYIEYYESGILHGTVKKMHLEEILLLILFTQTSMEIYLILLMERKILKMEK